MPCALARLGEAERDRIFVLWHHHPQVTKAAIAARFGLKVHDLDYAAAREGWAKRRRLLVRRQTDGRAGQGSMTLQAGASIPSGPPDVGAAAQAVARQSAAQIAALEGAIASGEVEPDKAARTLASLVRTLKTAQTLEPPAGAAGDDGPDDPPPRSLGELRDELLAHLDRLASEEGARRGDPPPRADGADPAP